MQLEPISRLWNTQNLQTLSKCSATMDASKQQCNSLMNKSCWCPTSRKRLHEGGKTFSAWSNHSGEDDLEVADNIRCERSRKVWKRTDQKLVRMANQNPHLTAKTPQEALAKAFHCTAQRGPFLSENLENGIPFFYTLKELCLQGCPRTLQNPRSYGRKNGRKSQILEVKDF